MPVEALRALCVPTFLVVFFAVVLLAAAFLPVPFWAGVAFFGEVARWTRPTVRFTAAAIFLPARPVVPLAGVDFAAVSADADVRVVGFLAGVAFVVVVFLAVVAFFVVTFLAGAVLRAVVVLPADVVLLAGVLLRVGALFAATVLLAPVVFAALVFFAVLAFAAVLVFLAVLAFAAVLVFFAVLGFPAAFRFAAPAVEVRVAVPVDRADVDLADEPVLDARRAAGRVVALLPATISVSFLRTFYGFVSFGDNGVSRVGPRYDPTGLALLPGPAGVFGLPLLVTFRHPLQRLLSFGLRGVGTEPVLGGAQIRPGLHALMTETPEVLATRSAVAHENTVHRKTPKRYRFAQKPTNISTIDEVNFPEADFPAPSPRHLACLARQGIHRDKPPFPAACHTGGRHRTVDPIRTGQRADGTGASGPETVPRSVQGLVTAASVVVTGLAVAASTLRASGCRTDSRRHQGDPPDVGHRPPPGRHSGRGGPVDGAAQPPPSPSRPSSHHQHRDPTAQ
ncbi:hypothetical protein O7632_13430 [Solwaraspora sp. WMMD406]|uniref:hypothetical protein n=1 Tax=Solwaraspora sp. WMMD406 TaxID=3016095 RepID=UPI00241746F6|nr:hypothetical protein [Solwaraspora sp. WMMD406]MDG4765089.1 hypothetical protein [Solwaraspora sp. WMMD406]